MYNKFFIGLVGCLFSVSVQADESESLKKILSELKAKYVDSDLTPYAFQYDSFRNLDECEGSLATELENFLAATDVEVESSSCINEKGYRPTIVYVAEEKLDFNGLKDLYGSMEECQRKKDARIEPFEEAHGFDAFIDYCRSAIADSKEVYKLVLWNVGDSNKELISYEEKIHTIGNFEPHRQAVAAFQAAGGVVDEMTPEKVSTREKFFKVTYYADRAKIFVHSYEALHDESLKYGTAYFSFVNVQHCKKELPFIKRMYQQMGHKVWTMHCIPFKGVYSSYALLATTTDQDFAPFRAERLFGQETRSPIESDLRFRLSYRNSTKNYVGVVSSYRYTRVTGVTFQNYFLVGTRKL